MLSDSGSEHSGDEFGETECRYPLRSRYGLPAAAQTLPRTMSNAEEILQELKEEHCRPAQNVDHDERLCSPMNLLEGLNVATSFEEELRNPSPYAAPVHQAMLQSSALRNRQRPIDMGRGMAQNDLLHHAARPRYQPRTNANVFRIETEDDDVLPNVPRHQAPRRLHVPKTRELKDVEGPRPRGGAPSMSEIQTAIKVVKFFQGFKTKNPTQWLQKFEDFARISRWTNEGKCYTFGLLMSGPSGSWFANLSDKIRQTYALLKTSFLTTYGIDEAMKLAHDVEFSGLRQKEDETVESYIETMITKAAELGKDEDDIRDAILRGLQPHVQAYVLSKGPRKLADVISSSKVGEKLYPQSNAKEMAKIVKMLEEIKGQQQSSGRSHKVAAIRETEPEMEAYTAAIQSLQAQQEEYVYQLQMLQAENAEQQRALQEIQETQERVALRQECPAPVSDRFIRPMRFNNPDPAHNRPRYAGFAPQPNILAMKYFDRDNWRPSSAFNGNQDRERLNFPRNKGVRTGGFPFCPDAGQRTDSPFSADTMCASCGSNGHRRMFCPFRNSTCFHCSQTGHIARACRQLQGRGGNTPPNAARLEPSTSASLQRGQGPRPMQ